MRYLVRSPLRVHPDKPGLTPEAVDECPQRRSLLAGQLEFGHRGMADHDAFNQGFFEIRRLVILGNDAKGRRRHKWAVTCLLQIMTTRANCLAQSATLRDQ